MAEGGAHPDGSRKAAVYLLALLHEARRAQSPTSPVSHRHPTVAPGVHRGPSTSKRGDPFEEAKFEEAKTWSSLPSLHQVHSLFDAVACATNTHPSRVPPLVTAAMTLLSRASAGQSRHLIPGLPPNKLSWSRALAVSGPLEAPLSTLMLLPWALQVRCVARVRSCSPAPTGACCCSRPSASPPSTWTTTTSASSSSSGCTPAMCSSRLSALPEPHPGRLFRARLAALWLPDTLSHQLGAYPDQRPLTIQALRQLMCPPAAAAAAGRAAQRPRWAGRWRGRWRGLRERLLRLWATARAAAQLLRLRASRRASRAPTAGGSTSCGAALPGARPGSKWLLSSRRRCSAAPCRPSLVAGLMARGAASHSGAQSRAAPTGATRSPPQSVDEPPSANRCRASPEHASRRRRARCCNCTAAGSHAVRPYPLGPRPALEACAWPFRVPGAGCA